jgi:hypothetical protein
MSSTASQAASNQAAPSPYKVVFGALFGAFLGLSMLKFGNPVIMERWVTAPSDIYEFVLNSPWPMSWAYLLLGLMVLASIPLLRWGLPTRRWLGLLPLAWCCWQLVAASGTSDAYLTACTVKHFIATVLCFFLGFFTLGGIRQLGGFWLALIICFLLVMAAGWSQRFGGLDQTRQYFFLYIYPQMKEVPPEYLKKMASNRIFGTLFYPNTHLSRDLEHEKLVNCLGTGFPGWCCRILDSALPLLVRFQGWMVSGAIPCPPGGASVAIFQESQDPGRRCSSSYRGHRIYDKVPGFL